MDPIPARVDAATKTTLLDALREAISQGWPLAKACRVLRLSERRARRWITCRDVGAPLADARPGASVNALTPQEVAAILDAFETFGVKDFSHRRLAHRGSYEALFWACPSTVRRVLNDHDLRFRHPPRPAPSQRRPFPDWASYTPNSIWIYDTTHFTRAGVGALFIEDLVSRKWITTIVSAEETHTQVQAAFEQALDAEGLLDAALKRAEARDQAKERATQQATEAAGPLTPDGPEEVTPILLAVSDNGSQMISTNTREFMALVAIAQHFGRPSTPTDQAWIESLNGTVKAEWPHLTRITDPALLRAELEDVRIKYNTTRLHSGIGYITPDDEHAGHGPATRAARKDGLARAAQERLAYHRNHPEESTQPRRPR